MKIVFESGLICPVCGDELLGASKNEVLLCCTCREPFPYRLCSFCEYGISEDMLDHDVSHCLLLGRMECVRFCRYFVRGAPFGEDKTRDIGERRIKAEKILSAVLFETCRNCKYYNQDKTIVITTVKGEPVKDIGSYSGKLPIRLGKDASRAYCKIHKTCKRNVKCKYFKPKKRSDKIRFKQQQKRIQKYLEEARLLEAYIQASLSII